MRTMLILWLVSVLCIDIEAQSPMYGLPEIKNIPRSEYAGGLQSWSFTETDNGLLYFANNLGLLEYNGTQWSVYKSIKAVNRAVCAVGNRIYVGAFNEFGFYEENEKGRLVYHSLVHKVKEKIGDFDEIWRIHKTTFGIVFQSFKAIFIYRNENVDIIYPPSTFHFSYYVNGILWVYDEEHGLMQYLDGKVKSVPGGEYFVGIQIWSILPLNDSEVIIGTSSKGLFLYNGRNVIPWDSKINEQLKKYQVYSAKKLKNNYFAFGTIQKGLIVSDTSGNLIFEMNKERGLQNNTVLGIGQDYKGNIWLCLDNGISMIKFDSPISFFQTYFDIGTGYASSKFGDNIYLGTNQGLFYINENDFINPSKTKSDFNLIEGTEGQVWNLSMIDNTLFCGHNNGVFQIQGNKAVKISSISGAWNFLKINDKGLILVGSYTGLSILENRDGSWHFRNKIKGFEESSRFVQYDQLGNIWVSQTYKGIFKVKTDSLWRNVLNTQLYTSKNGLPSDQSNLLFKIQSKVLVATEKGIYKFNNGTQMFDNDLEYAPYFDKGMQVDYLYQDSEQNIWFSIDKKIGVLRLQEDGSFKKITTPFLNLTNVTLRSFENIQELDQNNVLIGIEGGFANYISKYNKDYSELCTIYISDFRSKDSTAGIYSYNGKKSGQTFIPAFKYKNNSVSISFSANNYGAAETGFQYRLIEFDEKWSEWTTQNFKEYTNLPDGHYTFMLRANNNDQTAPSELSFKFIILAPWYRSVFAWIIYFVLLILIIYLGKRYLNFRIEKSRMAEIHKQKEIYLTREMNLKEKELANTTMAVIQKNNFLIKLQSDLRNINSILGKDLAKNNINTLITRIDKEIDSEKQWKVFNMHVEQVNEDLFKKLIENYPDLTPRELSLCAYLRMNISSKEIATLMNISARGVEISRYRIRKKLRLDREANLTEFMINF